MEYILQFFHHIHHQGNRHFVHHCGGAHVSRSSNDRIRALETYRISHCKCGMHAIDKSEAIGHDWEGKKVVFSFSDTCPQGGYHVESGKEVSNA